MAEKKTIKKRTIKKKPENTLEKAMGLLITSQVETNKKLDLLIDKLGNNNVTTEPEIVEKEDLDKIRKKQKNKIRYQCIGIRGKNPDGSDILSYENIKEFSTNNDATAYGMKVYGQGNYKISQVMIPQPAN